MTKLELLDEELVEATRREMSAERLKIAGPVETRIHALKEEYAAKLDKLADAELAAFLKDGRGKFEIPLTISALIDYLEDEHERRAAWEKATDERLDTLESDVRMARRG